MLDIVLRTPLTIVPAWVQDIQELNPYHHQEKSEANMADFFTNVRFILLVPNSITRAPLGNRSDSMFGWVGWGWITTREWELKGYET